MGAKFKAPPDSHCFADMEEQHFRLPLPPCVCLSFALLSFNSFPSLVSLSLPPLLCFSSPLFFENIPHFIQRPPHLVNCSLFVCPLLLLPCLVRSFLFNCWYIWFSAAPLFLRSPSLYLNPALITYASLSNLTDSDQCAAAGMLSLCKELPLTPGPNRA